MFVYVVGHQDGSQPWKIGRTTDPVTRLKDLQTPSPVPLAYIKIVEAHPTLEGSLHRQFAKYRVHGEWFNLPHEMTEVLLARLDGAPWIIQLAADPRRKRKGWKKANRYVTRRSSDGFRLDPKGGGG